MASTRRYRLICPIARALDRVGDRWTLLILRDLHAGPARFSDLQTGLTGIAANLLTDRLQQLVDDGLIEKVNGEYGVVLYQLTKTGQNTRSILFELALFGGQFALEEEPKRPGNLRTIVVTLSTACQRVVTPDLNFEAELQLDGEPFVMSVRDGQVDMKCGLAKSPDVVLITAYDAMMAGIESEAGMKNFMKNHVEVRVNTEGKEMELIQLMMGAVRVLQG